MINQTLNTNQKVTGSGQLSLLASHLPHSTQTGLATALLEPVREFVNRDSKQVRAQLVRVGFSLASCKLRWVAPGQEALLDCLACVVEALHAGSLMIDDIQDADEMRRGKAALHIQIGVPRAINAANWLYFWPTELLRQQALEPAVELEIYRLFHKTMMRAHQGQALDLGHDMIHTSQADALEISVAAIELKTGELMAMCAELGAIVGGADAATRGCLAKFGLRFGVALQMFNDIGEVSQRNESINAHRPLQRPSWVWAVAARELEPADFSRFQRLASQATASADEDELLLRHVLAKANELAHAEFKTCMDEINDLVETDAHKATRLLLQELAQKVMRAYA